VVESGRHTRLRQRLADPAPLLAVELRPPRRDLEGSAAMEAWIDVYHAVRRLSSSDTLVFITDNAVGTNEEENLSHLVKNLGEDAVRERIAPFLTLKHELEYCVRYAQRAARVGFPALVVLGGDRHDGVPRCLPHACDLREVLRGRVPGLLLGGWANPYRGPEQQAEYIAREEQGLDFVLTQIVSHHDIEPLGELLRALERRGVQIPLFAGVFYYRSPNRRTLGRLSEFIPVPRDELVRDFRERSLSADEICARTIRAAAECGARHFYVSNLETGRAAPTLARIAGLAGFKRPGVASPAPDPTRRLARRPGPS
jgi:5,10-methylenetetrahydrofolate reductase